MATKVMSGIADRLINSLEILQKGNWYDDMQTYQDYPMLRMMMSMGKERGGNQLAWRIGVGSENTDGHHGLYEDYDLDRPDVMIKGNLDWRNHRKGFAIDLREIDDGSDPEHVIDDMKVQRNNMYSQCADDIETGAWQVPSSSETLLPHGIPYFVTWADVTGGGFTSQLPLGHTDVAGITPSVQTSYRNWSELYTTATRDDLGLKVSRAIRHTKWIPPEKVRGDQKVTHAIYMDSTTIEQNEIMAANQNDQLGMDTQPSFGRSMLARVSPTWVPILDSAAAASSNPVYLINHAYMFPYFKKGWKFKEFPPKRAAKQDTAIEVTLYTTYNYACVSRRRQAVIAKAAPFGEA